MASAILVLTVCISASAVIVIDTGSADRLEQMYINRPRMSPERDPLGMISIVPWTMIGTIGTPAAIASTNGTLLVRAQRIRASAGAFRERRRRSCRLRILSAATSYAPNAAFRFSRWISIMPDGAHSAAENRYFEEALPWRRTCSAEESRPSAGTSNQLDVIRHGENVGLVRSSLSRPVHPAL